MSGWILALIATVYVAAWLGDYRGATFRKRWQPLIYSLSLAVYCTSWTFFGAVGQASENLWSFIPIYLGPILVFVLFWKLLVKLITVSKRENITSIADFIASRHGLPLYGDSGDPHSGHWRAPLYSAAAKSHCNGLCSANK